MKAHIIGLSLFLLMLVPCTGQAQWMQMTAPPDSDVVYGLVAIDTNLFAVAGDYDGGQFGGTFSFIFNSTDQGASWTEVDSGLTAAIISSFPFADGLNLFVGTAYIGTGENGLFISTNNGTSWHPANVNSDSEATVEWLSESGGKLLAVTEDTGDSSIYGVYLSTDSGKSWTNTGLQNIGWDDPFASMGSNLFVGTLESGMYRSTNNDSSWTEADNGWPFDSAREMYLPVNALAVMGTNLFAGNDSGIFLTTDSGMNWTHANSGLPAKTSVDAFAESGTNIFAGTDRGVFLSTNSGMIWTSVNDGLTDTGVNCLLVYDTILFATTGYPSSAPSTIWRRPLSQMLPASAVATSETIAPPIQTYPNPFSQSTTFTFSSPESGMAEITIVNLLGSEVARIFSGELDAGQHSFSWDASGMPQGIYECRVKINAQFQQIPMLLTRN